MWSTFFIAMALAAVFLYAPGFFMLKAFRVRAAVALCCAPLFTVAAYAALTAVLPHLGIDASWQTVVMPCVAVGIVAAAVFRFTPRFASLNPTRLGVADMGRSFKKAVNEEWFSIVLYVLAGLAVVGLVFIKNLDGPDSFLQAWDNSHHLSSIRAFVESGNYSMLTTTSYATPLDRAFTPWQGEAAFYPSAWHCLAALVVSATGASVAMAANAVNALAVGIVLPLSLFVLMDRVFAGHRGIVRCGAFVALAFAVFPWGFLTFGPLYPNLLSYALLPLVAVLFMSIFDDRIAVHVRIARSVLFIVGIVALACSQPNAVFSLAVFLAPFCVMQAARMARFLPGSFAKDRPLAASVACGFIAAAAIALIWWGLFHAPFLQDVIWFDWPAKEEPTQALSNIVLLSFSYAPAQLVLALLVLCGLVCALADVSFRWFACSYLVACAICFVDLAFDGFLKHLLAGFWYTDQLRTASTAALFAIPLAALGLRNVVRFCATGLNRFVVSAGGRATPYVASVTVLALIISAVFYPNYVIPGHHYVETGFGAIRERVEEQNSVIKMNYLDADEKEFVREASAIVPDDQPIINSPDDGSVFLYGYEGMRTYYRYLTGYSAQSGESADSIAIRKWLYRIAEDDRVQQAVRSIGAEYVLVLDQGKDQDLGSDEEHRRFVFKDDIDNEQWSGIRAIDDNTPGFEVVLSRGDMRLYRIVV
ncbi:MAG: hypothetical protein Q4D92_05185 [Slackia sp.]|nr:hypothetical protein [Slackia sp.]